MKKIMSDETSELDPKLVDSDALWQFLVASIFLTAQGEDASVFIEDEDEALDVP